MPLFATIKAMDPISLIKKAGLSEAQAKGYLAILEHGSVSPAKLSSYINETRTNCYAILDKLEKYGLAEKTNSKRTTYRATHPSNLEVLAEQRRLALAENERLIKDNLSNILDIYYQNNEAPGALVYQGPEGVMEIYQDILRTGEDLYLINATEFQDLKQKLAKKKLQIFSLSENDSEDSNHTQIPNGAFPSSVQVLIYGHKLAFINHGETQNSVIIASPAIASAMKIVFNTLQNHWQAKLKQD